MKDKNNFDISQIVENASKFTASDISRGTGITYPTVKRILSFDKSVTLQNYLRVRDFLEARGY